MNNTLHVEVVQKRKSRESKDFVKGIVHSYLARFSCISPGTTLSDKDLEENVELNEHVQSITFCDIDHDTEVQMTNSELVYHVFKLDAFGVETDTMTDNASGEELAAADVWSLPSEEFHGLWESLVYDSKLKEDTLRFAETAFEFADRGVNPTIVGCNRVVLLHGPPGTGKTSLCRALAQKLAIRLGERFPRARLLEINAHGLFSKWFSESGKLVARLFERVRDIVEDRRLLACVLVDEVESLAHARRAALAGLEPSDSIRAVNAILTQLDRLRRHPNALVLATSNVTGAIDVAFVDRADVKRLVGPPTARAAYEILRGCCGELAARGVVVPRAGERLFSLRVLEGSRFADSEAARASLRLWAAASEAGAARVSARALRRLPLLARALHCAARPDLLRFVDALHAALRHHLADARDLHDEDQQ
ncbi:pachytene checkpoint protein 2 homolog [Amyelois transitella]|uniref:pachytene checkpoint protein 2 homolog n=1 Tax=Amyelois transitella TaxID=680683 RepID=UPI00067B3371|nr:pachytene checkpoint protein 2 homolog [Amyelois transitella]